ncbi:MAG: M23 family metallopeptidase [Chromatiales bacterium]|nr:M23 family metallopeptidase [Chromatiales bacterium]
MHLDRDRAPRSGSGCARVKSCATVGKSGRVTGPHLDWRMNWREARIDPALIVPAMP